MAVRLLKKVESALEEVIVEKMEKIKYDAKIKKKSYAKKMVKNT